PCCTQYILRAPTSALITFFSISSRRPPISTLFPYTTLFRSHVLIGDEQDLPLLRAVLASFPPDAVGEVLLELPMARRQRPLPRPVGLAVRILRRGPGQYPGLAACTALGAWVEAWVLGDHATAEGHAIFVGMPGNPLVERWCGEQLERIPRLHMHRPRHLGAPL